MSYYNDEYDAMVENDTREHAYAETERVHMQEAQWTAAETAASERYLAIGGPFADNAGAIGAESELDRATRRAPITAVPDWAAESVGIFILPRKVA